MSCLRCLKNCCKMISKVRQMRSAMKEIEERQLNAERAKLGLPPIRPWYQNLCITCCSGIGAALCCGSCGGDTSKPKCKIPMFVDGTYSNCVLKSFVGFFCGLLMSYIWLNVMVYQLEFSAVTSVIASCLMAVAFSLGLAFHITTRCVVLLMVPSMCSRQGRMALLAYMLVLIMMHPVANFRHNVQIMSESAACGQEAAHNVTSDVVDSALSPAQSILNNIRETIDSLVEFSERLRATFVKVRDLFMEVVAAIDMTFQWLGDMVNVCNERMGEPYRKCKAGFDRAIDNCNKKLGIMKFLCAIPKGFSYICHIARFGEILCHITESIKKFISKSIASKLTVAVQNVYDMFYFNVTLVYNYNLTVNQTPTSDKIRENIQQEVEERLRPLTSLTDAVNFIVLFLGFLVVIKALLYRRKYLTKDGFDNFYMSDHVGDIDARREEMNKETILPLNWRERSKYIKTFSIRLTDQERNKMIVGAVLLFGSILPGAFYILCDYGLYWLLYMLRRLGEEINVTEYIEVPGHIRMQVEGDGILADIYRTLITKFDPLEQSNTDMDSGACLPNPRKPNFHMYRVIGSLFGFSLFLVIFEAYGLRLLHLVAGYYYPERSRERAVWLYNRIIQRRGGSLKYLRRQMREDDRTTREQEKKSFASRMAASSSTMAYILKVLGYRRKLCLCCSTPGKLDDMDNFVHCDNAKCSAVYCHECFTDINNMCTVCMNPVEYGDFSDMSEERDSSGDSEDDPPPQKDAQKMRVKDIEKMLGVFAQQPSPQRPPVSQRTTVVQRPLDFSYQDRNKSELSSSDDDEDERRSSHNRRRRTDDLVSTDIFDDDSSTSSSETSDDERLRRRYK